MRPQVEEAETIRINFRLERKADPLLYDELKQFKKGSKRAEQLRAFAHDGVLARWGWVSGGSAPRRPGSAKAGPEPYPTRDADPAGNGTLSEMSSDMFGPPVGIDGKVT